ncbi:MAG: T9SS type A sorting domain-containing protein, partial [Chitinophagales bacterium]
AVVKTDESLQYYFERKTEEEIYDFATETALPPTYSTVIDTFTYFADTFREFRYTLDLAYYGLGFMGENASTYHRIVALQSSKQTYEITNQVLPNLTIVYDGLEQYDCEIQQLTDVSFQHSFNQSVGFNKKDSHCFGAFSETLIGYRIGNEESGDIEPIITNIESPTYFALQITLHPNPTNNRFTLRLKNPKQQTKNLQLKITDIHGRTLQQLPLLQASIEVDLSDQPNGIYLVQISDGKNWWTEKVVKY